MIQKEEELIDEYMMKVANERKNEDCNIDLADAMMELGIDPNEILKSIDEND
jgi:hypothetical protein